VTIVESGLKRPEGLACDWINNKIYWTDSEAKRIEVTSVDPDPIYRRVLYWQDIDLPRAIAVAPNDGVMFWCLLKNKLVFFRHRRKSI
jgi:low density lipoprotein receptor-related protein 5/6